MKIVDLFEELAEFEPTPYESKKAEIAHMQKKRSAINHRRTIVFQQLLSLGQRGLVMDKATAAKVATAGTGVVPPNTKLIPIPGTGGPETNYDTLYYPEGNKEVLKISNEVAKLATQDKAAKERIKDLTVRGHTFCFTGFRDEQLETKIMRQGGKVVSSAIQDLNYLVAKDPHSHSGKMLKAKQNGAKIIGKQELEDFLRD